MFSDVFLYNGHMMFLLYFVSLGSRNGNFVHVFAATRPKHGGQLRHTSVPQAPRAPGLPPER